MSRDVCKISMTSVLSGFYYLKLDSFLYLSELLLGKLLYDGRLLDAIYFLNHSRQSLRPSQIHYFWPVWFCRSVWYLSSNGLFQADCCLCIRSGWIAIKAVREYVSRSRGMWGLAERQVKTNLSCVNQLFVSDNSFAIFAVGENKTPLPKGRLTAFSISALISTSSVYRVVSWSIDSR